MPLPLADPLLRPIVFIDNLGLFPANDDRWPQSGLLNLASLHRKYNPQYVLTDAARHDDSGLELPQLLHRRGLSFVAENLHDRWSTPSYQESNLRQEVNAWYATAAIKYPLSFLILTTKTGGKSLYADKLADYAVFCDFADGFAGEYVVAALRILRSQIPRMPATPLVFLDLDDVLAVNDVYTSSRVMQAFKDKTTGRAAELWQNVFSGELRRNLQVLHDEFSLDYVISSSWSSFLDREQILEVLHRTQLGFVTDNLHPSWTTPKSRDATRRAEIQAWLDENYPDSKGVQLVLDDHVSGWSLRGAWFEHNVIFCDAHVGFDRDKLRAAQLRIRAQLK